MKCILAAVAGAILASLFVVEAGIGWDLTDPMLRERLFFGSLNGLFCGWLFGLGAHFFGKKLVSRAFLLGLAAGLGFGNFFLGGFALAVAAIAIMRPIKIPERPLVLLGLGAHLAPIAVFFGMTPNWEVVPLLPAPELAPSSTTAAVPTDAPDTVMILVDTLRADVILDPEVPTPVMDSLRAKGAWAPYAIAPANQTLPSHLVLLTGFDIEKIGMRGNYSRWPSTELLDEQENRTLATRFLDAGYRTAAVLTNPLLWQIKEDSGYQEFEEGFETWHGLKHEDSFTSFMDWARAHWLLGQASSWTNPRFVSYPLNQLLNDDARRNYRVHYAEGQRTTDSALHYLDQLKTDARPYFLFVQYFDPHSPYVPPTEFANTIATDDKLPEGYANTPTDAFMMRVTLRDDLRDRKVEDGGARGAFLHDLYKEEVAYFDQQLGRLIEAIEATGRPTNIVFTSDHGEGFGEHRNVEHGETLYEEEYRVPFLVVGPNVVAQELKQVPEMIDASHTLLAMSGLDTQGFDGRNVLTTDDVPARPSMTVMIDRVAMEMGGWILHTDMRYADSKKLEEGEVRGPSEVGEYELKPERLFDLKADAAQLVDLLESNPDRAAALMEQIHERMKLDLYPYISPRNFTSKEVASLAALGYALTEDE